MPLSSIEKDKINYILYPMELNNHKQNTILPCSTYSISSQTCLDVCKVMYI